MHTNSIHGEAVLVQRAVLDEGRLEHGRAPPVFFVEQEGLVGNPVAGLALLRRVQDEVPGEPEALDEPGLAAAVGTVERSDAVQPWRLPYVCVEGEAVSRSLDGLHAQLLLVPETGPVGQGKGD